MKNRDFIRRYLLVLIIVLIVIASLYTFFNRESITFSSETPNTSTSKGSKVENENKENENKNDEVEPNPSVPKYSSSNESETPGLRVVSTYEEFNELSARDGVNTFFVLGRKGCHYCELYQPILKEVAELYKIEVAYIDLAALSNDDYYKVLHSPLKIPAKCSKTGEETDLSYGFGTPLSLFVSNNSTYNCIRGYKDKTNLISSLKEIGYIN